MYTFTLVCARLYTSAPVACWEGWIIQFWGSFYFVTPAFNFIQARLLIKFYSNQAYMQCRNPINRVCTFYTYHMCGAYMSEGKKKLPILTYIWSIFENINLSGMVFTLESSDMSFLSAPGSYSWCCKHNAKT